MKEIKKFAWEKPKTLYRYVNSGDLFCWLCFNKVLILRRYCRSSQFQKLKILTKQVLPHELRKPIDA